MEQVNPSVSDEKYCPLSGFPCLSFKCAWYISKKEAYNLFNALMAEIQSETVRHLFRARFGVQVYGEENIES